MAVRQANYRRREGRLARDPVHDVIIRVPQGIESDHFRLRRNMPRVVGFQASNTARRSIQGFKPVLWLFKGSSSPTRVPSSSTTTCSGSASDVRMGTRRMSRPAPARSAACSGVCDRLGIPAQRTAPLLLWAARVADHRIATTRPRAVAPDRGRLYPMSARSMGTPFQALSTRMAVTVFTLTMFRSPPAKRSARTVQSAMSMTRNRTRKS